MSGKREYRGLSLVGSKEDRMAAASQPRPPLYHAERSGYIADVVVSQGPGYEIFHYVIQPVNSREIVHWGQETSLQRAKECISDFLNEIEKRKA